MTKKGIVILKLFTLVATLFIANQLWAVIGDAEIQVTDDAGNGVPGATVTLFPPGETPVTAQTNDQGIVNIKIEEGTYEVEVVFDHQKERGTITVPGKLTITVPRKVFPGEPPVSLPSNVQIVPSVESLDDVTRTASSSTITTTVRDSSGNESTTTSTENADQNVLDKANAAIVQALDMNIAGAEVNIGLGSYGGSAYGNRAIDLRNRPYHPTAYKSSWGGSGNGAGRKMFYPSVSFMIGRADLDLEFLPSANPSAARRFEGDGLVLGGGFHALFFLCGDCGWYAGADYNYEKISDLKTDINPSFVPADAISITEEGNFDYESHRIQGIVGYNFAHAAPYGGIRGSFRKATLDLNNEADFSSRFPGFTVISVLAFTEELEENTVEGVAGIDFRFGHFVTGVEGSFDANNFRVRFRGGFGF